MKRPLSSRLDQGWIAWVFVGPFGIGLVLLVVLAAKFLHW